MSSWSKHFKGSLAVKSDGVAGLKWTGRGILPRNNHADVRSSFVSIVTAGQQIQVIDCNCYCPLAVEQRIVRYKKGSKNIAVDQTETIKVDGEGRQQEKLVRTCRACPAGPETLADAGAP